MSYRTQDEGVQNMTDRRRLIAMMMAAGWGNQAIARHFDLNPNSVSTMRTSPLFRAVIAEMQAELRANTIDETMALIERETGASVEMLVKIRGQAPDSTHAERNVQRQAANDLIALNPRVAPRARGEIEHVHKIVFSRQDLQQMQRALGDGPPALASANAGTAADDTDVEP